MQSLIANSLQKSIRLPTLSTFGKVGLNQLKPVAFNSLRQFSKTPLTRECKFNLLNFIVIN